MAYMLQLKKLATPSPLETHNQKQIIYQQNWKRRDQPHSDFICNRRLQKIIQWLRADGNFCKYIAFRI